MDLHEDAVIEAVVSSVEQFGILVEFEGKGGVILETNVYWDHEDVHRRMLEEFKPGQKIRAKVLVVAPRQFSASIKHLHPERDPWLDPSIYSVGTIHAGIVKLIFDFGGALVRLPNGVDVFVGAPKPGVTLKDRVNVVVTSLDVERQKIEANQV
jgi:ribosomal protein S1